MAEKKSAPGDQPRRKRKRAARAAAAEVARQEKINEALDYRRQGYTYRQIAETVGISASTAYEWVQEGLAAIPAENAKAVKALALGRYDEMMQRLMPLLDDGAPKDVIDGLLRIQDKINALNGIGGSGGLSIELPSGYNGDDESIIIARIMATAPALRPDMPGPANPIL